MAQKRTATEAELLPVRTRRNSKRSRVSSTSDSSEQSIRSVSEVSAMRSSPGASEDTRPSSPPTQDEAGDVSESTVSSTSSDSSSSDEEDDDDEADGDEEEVVTLGGPKKPQIDSQRLKSNADELRRKLQAFMPKMQQANSGLAAQGGTLSMEDVGEDEQHIEMSLGLGVLEEQRHGDVENESDEESEQQGSDVMQTLLGLAGEQKKYSVEEVKTDDT